MRAFESFFRRPGVGRFPPASCQIPLGRGKQAGLERCAERVPERLHQQRPNPLRRRRAANLGEARGPGPPQARRPAHCGGVQRQPQGAVLQDRPTRPQLGAPHQLSAAHTEFVTGGGREAVEAGPFDRSHWGPLGRDTQGRQGLDQGPGEQGIGRPESLG